MMETVAMRLALCVVALLTAAWLGLSLRNAVLVNEGLLALLHAASHGAPLGASARGEAASAEQRLHDAGLLNPDRRPVAYEAMAMVQLGRPEGVTRLSELLRAHPAEPRGWAGLNCSAGPPARGLAVPFRGCMP
jgi:hypothetical protein